MGTQLGVYKPSFLNIKINLPGNFSNLRKLKRKVKAVYFHEYTHFLQNISTTFGLSTTWSHFWKIREVIRSAQLQTTLTLPLDNPIVQSQRENFNALQAIHGDYHLHRDYTDNGDFWVTDLSLQRDAAIDLVTEPGTIKTVQLKLTNKNEQNTYYSFGSMAVEESMAYLMEKKLYKAKTQEPFPYCAAEKLAAYTCNRIAGNPEYLFAVCDTALMSAYPGWLFYLILLEIEQQDFIPAKTEDIYAFALTVFEKRGWDVMGEFKKAKDAILSIFNEIYFPIEFDATRQWFITVIEEAYKMRLNSISLMLNLYRDKVFGPEWEKVVAKIGFPEMHTPKHERWFSAPLALKANEDNIEPIFLIALWQIQDLLLRKTVKCQMLPFCSQSKRHKKIIDDNCINAPWKKVTDGPNCAFCALWQTTGLANKTIA